MSTQEEIPDRCPRCGGDVRLRPIIDGTALGSGKKEWRCAKACMSWTAQGM
jgi:hypothetical protein